MNRPPDRPVNILVVGVGGQGTILASELLATVLMDAGYEVKKSEVHGMSQRGGRVESHVRFGPCVYAPLIVKGEVDYLVGFELSETLRSMEWLSPDAKIITDTKAILSYTSQVGDTRYPFDAIEKISEKGYEPAVIDGESLADELGEKKTANIVLMGRLASYLPVERQTWENAIRSNFPEKLVELNLRAFDLGYSAV